MSKWVVGFFLPIFTFCSATSFAVGQAEYQEAVKIVWEAHKAYLKGIQEETESTKRLERIDVLLAALTKDLTDTKDLKKAPYARASISEHYQLCLQLQKFAEREQSNIALNEAHDRPKDPTLLSKWKNENARNWRMVGSVVNDLTARVQGDETLSKFMGNDLKGLTEESLKSRRNQEAQLVANDQYVEDMIRLRVYLGLLPEATSFLSKHALKIRLQEARIKTLHVMTGKSVGAVTFEKHMAEMMKSLSTMKSAFPDLPLFPHFADKKTRANSPLLLAIVDAGQGKPLASRVPDQGVWKDILQAADSKDERVKIGAETQLSISLKKVTPFVQSLSAPGKKPSAEKVQDAVMQSTEIKSALVAVDIVANGFKMMDAYARENTER